MPLDSSNALTFIALCELGQTTALQPGFEPVPRFEQLLAALQAIEIKTGHPFRMPCLIRGNSILQIPLNESRE